MSTRFILVRHGETPASKERRFAGVTDVELTPRGREMAESLGRRLRQVRIDVVHCSPLLRCRQTAEAVSEATGHKPRLTEEIRELDFGRWENRTLQEVSEQYPDEFQRWITDDAFTPPDGESWTQLGERLGRWWAETAERYDGRTVLAVTHGGPILWLARHVTQGPYQSMFAFEIDPCSITLIQNRRYLWRLRLLNDTTHVRDPLLEGPPPAAVPP